MPTYPSWIYPRGTGCVFASFNNNETGSSLYKYPLLTHHLHCLVSRHRHHRHRRALVMGGVVVLVSIGGSGSLALVVVRLLLSSTLLVL